MIECKICSNTFNTMRGLSFHIKKEHNIDSKQYYDIYLKKPNENICSICGKETKFHNITLGYYKRCSRGCANKTEIPKESVRNTKNEKYGCYNYNNPQKISEVLHSRSKEEIENSVEKSKQTRIIRYNDPNYNNPKKRVNTMLKKNSIKMSKGEQYCYLKLLNKFDKVDYQYFDNDRYPYFCDFYIPEIDLFIELHFTWLHGKHKYDEVNDAEQLNKWKEKSISSNYYKKAIYVWTIDDVNRYNTAIKNNLNYKTFYNQLEFDNWFNSL